MRLALFLAFLLCAGTAHAQSQAVVGFAGVSTNSSGQITVGKTFQSIAPQSLTRQQFSFQNVCNKAGNCSTTTDLCYLYMEDNGVPTLSNSLIVTAGQEYLRSVGRIPGAAIQATCDTSGDNFRLSISQ